MAKYPDLFINAMMKDELGMDEPGETCDHVKSGKRFIYGVARAHCCAPQRSALRRSLWADDTRLNP